VSHSNQQMGNSGSSSAGQLPQTVQLHGGWPPRMGTYEFDGYNDGKARYRNKSVFPQTWHHIVWSARFGMWQIATNPNGQGQMPLYVNRSINQHSPQLPPVTGWVVGDNEHTEFWKVKQAGHVVLEFAQVLGAAQGRPALPSGFRFQDGFGEATRGDQIGHIISGGVEGHCFKGDKMKWPLHWAAMIGDIEAIYALVAAGHDPNVKMTDWFDSEPLGWAASFGQCKAIEALCEAGADPSRPANLAGNTPLSDAQREGHTKTVELIKEYLSGARCRVSDADARARQLAAAQPTAQSVPVVQSVPVAQPALNVPMGMPVEAAVPAASSSSATTPMPPLNQACEEFKRELGVGGANFAEVVDAACEMLGISTKGLSLMEKAQKCWTSIKG